MKRVRLMQGSEALCEGAIAAGVRFFAGYPITPATEIVEKMSEMLPKVGGKFIRWRTRSPVWAQPAERRWQA